MNTPRLTRAERADANRRALFASAAKVVGELGYKDASVARITQAAGLASGTFYVYFQSQQELFDQLLPTVGENILEYLAEKTPEFSTFAEAEEAWFRALFYYFFENPGYFRILHEAEVYAPQAFEIHLKDIVNSYRNGIVRRWIVNADSARNIDEIELIAVMLTGIRPYIYKYYFKDGFDANKFEDIVEAYMSFILHGVGQVNPRSDLR